MAEKRYYWLKLKEYYLSSPKIKKLRRIAGGDTYTIIYLKMQLLSIKNQGIIEYEQIEPTFEEELALKLDEDVENVKITLAYLQAQSLIESCEENKFLLIDASNNIGSEGQSAERVRNFREKERQVALQCNASVTQVKRNSISISNSNIYNNNNKEEDNKDNNKKEQKHKYGQYNNVLLTDTEYNNLTEKYTKEKTDEAVAYLDEYIERKGYKAKSHYLCIMKWVFDAIKEDKIKKDKLQKEQGKNFTEREYTKKETENIYVTDYDNIELR